MARTTDAEVQKIISLNVLTTTDPFITTANLLVTQHLGSSGMSAALLEQVEKYLAAHLTALHPDERQLREQEIGDSTDRYAGKFSDMLDFTQFGQQVKLIDYTGTFADLGGPQVSICTIDVDYDQNDC